MPCRTHIVLTALFLFIVHSIFSSVPGPSKPGRGVRFYAGSGIGFYHMYSKHAVYSSPRMCGVAGFKKEWRCDKAFKSFFQWGLDYYFHGLNYRSYYFDQDTLQLYDNSFSYNYKLFVQEVNMPLHVKFSFLRENNSLYSPYVFFGYDLRLLLPVIANVSLEGAPVDPGKSSVRFRTPLLYERLNSSVSLGVGFQKNIINNSKSGFFTELRFRYGFSHYQFSAERAANAVYFNGSHLMLNLGLKF